MNDSSFVLFAVAALFLIGMGWFLFMDEREFSQQDEDEAAANLLAYQRRYNERIVVLAEKEKPQIAAAGR